MLQYRQDPDPLDPQPVSNPNGQYNFFLQDRYRLLNKIEGNLKVNDKKTLDRF